MGTSPSFLTDKRALKQDNRWSIRGACLAEKIFLLIRIATACIFESD